MLVWAVLAAAATAADPALELGFEGHVHLGRWSAVSVAADGPGVLEASDALGNRVRYPAEFVRSGESGGRLSGLVRFGKLRDTLAVIDPESEDVLTSVELDEELLPWSARLWATVSPGTGLSDAVRRLNDRPLGSEQIKLIELDAADFPAEADRLAEVDVISWNGSPPSPEVSAALGRWVAEGGHLVLSLGGRANDWQSSEMADWLPVRILDETSRRDLSPFQVAMPNSRRLRLLRPLRAIRIAPADGVQTVKVAEDLVLRAVRGFGRVTVTGVDLNNAVFDTWASTPLLYLLMTDRTPQPAAESRTANRRLTRTGVTDIQTQILASVESVPGVERATNWRVLWTIALLGMLLGPVDYLLVHRVFRRPQLTWFTMPLLVIAGAWVTSLSASATNGTELVTRRLDVIDVDAVDGFSRGVGWSSAYVPRLGRYDLSADTPLGVDGVRTGWCAPGEGNFGGLYRIGGGLNSAAYSEGAGLRELVRRPIGEWSTALLETTWAAGNGDLVTAGLSRDSGYVAGTIEHTLPGTVRNWLIAFDDRVVRPRDEFPIEPGKQVTLSRDAVKAENLSDFLTGLQRTRVARDVVAGQEDLRTVSQRRPYDPTSQDVLRTVRTATFHTITGGSDYTGLESHHPYGFDLTPLMKSGRAVLLGVLDSPGAEVRVNGESREPDASATFVRIVLTLSDSPPSDGG